MSIIQGFMDYISNLDVTIARSSNITCTDGQNHCEMAKLTFFMQSIHFEPTVWVLGLWKISIKHQVLQSNVVENKTKCYSLMWFNPKPSVTILCVSSNNQITYSDVVPLIHHSVPSCVFDSSSFEKELQHLHMILFEYLK